MNENNAFNGTEEGLYQKLLLFNELKQRFKIFMIIWNNMPCTKRFVEIF